MIDWSDKNLPTLSNKRLTNKLLESVERERERERMPVIQIPGRQVATWR